MWHSKHSKHTVTHSKKSSNTQKQVISQVLSYCNCPMVIYIWEFSLLIDFENVLGSESEVHFFPKNGSTLKTRQPKTVRLNEVHLDFTSSLGKTPNIFDLPKNTKSLLLSKNRLHVTGDSTLTEQCNNNKPFKYQDNGSVSLVEYDGAHNDRITQAHLFLNLVKWVQDYCCWFMVYMINKLLSLEL